MGEPKLSERNARYAVPFWLDSDEGNRIYHIESSETSGSTTSLELGNSFLLPNPLRDLEQRRAFSYRKLSDLGLVEISEGLLTPLPESVSP